MTALTMRSKQGEQVSIRVIAARSLPLFLAAMTVHGCGAPEGTTTPLDRGELGDGAGGWGKGPAPSQIPESQFHDVYRSGEAFYDPRIVDDVLQDDPPPRSEKVEEPESDEIVDGDESDDDPVVVPEPAPAAIPHVEEPSSADRAAILLAGLERGANGYSTGDEIARLPREEVVPGFLALAQRFDSLSVESQRAFLQVAARLRVADEPTVRAAIYSAIVRRDTGLDASQACCEMSQKFGLEFLDAVLFRIPLPKDAIEKSNAHQALALCRRFLKTADLLIADRQRFEAFAMQTGLSFEGDPEVQADYLALPLISAVKSGRDIDSDLVLLRSVSAEARFLALCQLAERLVMDRDVTACSQLLESEMRASCRQIPRFSDERLRADAVALLVVAWPHWRFGRDGKIFVDPDFCGLIETLAQDESPRVRENALHFRDATAALERGRY